MIVFTNKRLHGDELVLKIMETVHSTEIRFRDKLIPWLYFNLFVAILPVLLKILIRALRSDSNMWGALYEEPDFLLASFAICGATMADLVEGRARGFIKKRPNGMYFTLFALGLPAFVAYVWYIYDRMEHKEPSNFQNNVTAIAVYWVIASAVFSVTAKPYAIRKENRP